MAAGRITGRRRTYPESERWGAGNDAWIDEIGRRVRQKVVNKGVQIGSEMVGQIARPRNSNEAALIAGAGLAGGAAAWAGRKLYERYKRRQIQKGPHFTIVRANDSTHCAKTDLP